LKFAQDMVGSYELVRLLGVGGFCKVYEARDRATHEPVALKRREQVEPQALSDFKREFRTVQGLHHPNLVELRELFEDGSSCFIAMELIDGEDLIAYLRRQAQPAAFDRVTLCDAFRQLTEALVALHDSGVVHRDIKPRNVLVTELGRAVLLDFGLAHTGSSDRSAAVPGIGTTLYMAPEQASGASLGPAADFYALGACLYEALAGRPPGCSNPPLPSSLRPGMPADLETLCMRLLAPDPAQRPAGPELLRVFASATQRSAAPLRSLPAAEGFAGRECELAVLRDSLQCTRRGEFAVVLLEGESGIGKSALVAEFLAGVANAMPDALVLRSRCYENELLAYKAFDGGLEQLALMLSDLDRKQCDALLPPHALLLSRVFPALCSVRAVTEACATGLPADPAAQRNGGFNALCMLLGAIAAQRPLLIEIDDLQWADAESFRLLRALVEDPERPAVFIIATVRPPVELSEQAARGVELLASQACTRSLTLGGLAPASARALAAQLLGSRADAPTIETLVSESGGHPLLLSELVRYLDAGDRQNPRAAIRLDDALRARIEGLAPPAQQLVSAIAVAGRPHPAQLFARVTSLGLAELNACASELLAGKLLRRRGSHELACYHDRIRQVAQSRLDAQAARALHARLAAALAAQPVADPGELATHYEASGQAAAALAAYTRAAEQALSSLAFARAEQLASRALGLAASVGATEQRVNALQVTRAHALARGGRSADAAQQFLEAAETTTGEAKTRLRILAAQHLLQSARVEEGMRAARDLLAELGVPPPASPAFVMARLVWDRTWLSLRGFQPRAAPSAIPVLARMQLDALYGLAVPIAWLDPQLSAALSARHARLAQALGEPAHLARALAEEAFARAFGSSDNPEIDALLEQARGLASQNGDPGLQVAVSFREGTVAVTRWQLGRWRERLEHAQQVAIESCPEQPWMLTNVRIPLAGAWLMLGEHKQFAASTGAWIAEARERSDQFAMTLVDVLACGVMRHLMTGDIDLARARLHAALAPWPRKPFSMAHFGEVATAGYIELYAGGDRAHRWFQERLEQHSREFLLKMNFGKTHWLALRAGACLAARATASKHEAAALLAQARGHARALGRIHFKLAALQRSVIEAQCSALSGEFSYALQSTQRARQQTEDDGHKVLAMCLTFMQGLLEGGSEGRELEQSALGFFAAQGWKHPRRAISIWCPALDELETRC
jgi:eukaryotic-like serine/threonine-protein kinase